MENWIAGFIILELGLLLVLAKIFGEAFERIRLPSILGEISLGVIAGPVLGIIIISQSAPILTIFAVPQHNEAVTVVEILAEIGAIFLLFSIGFEKVDIERLTISVRRALPVAIIGAAFPFSAGCMVAYTFSSELFLKFSIDPVMGSLLVGTALASTSIGVSARTLIDLKYISTLAGATVLFATVLDNVLSLGTLAIITGIVQTGSVSYENLFRVIGEIALFGLIIFIVGKFIFPLVAKFADKMIVDEAIIAIVTGSLFVFAYLTKVLGLHMIIGAFLFGLCLSVIPRLKTDAIVHKVRGISYGFFVPFFFINVGLLFDFGVIDEAGKFAVILLTALIVSQIASGFIGGVVSKFKLRDAFIIGVALIPRSEMALIVTTVGLGLGVLTTQVFSALVLIAVVTTIITPLMLRLVIKKE